MPRVFISHSWNDNNTAKKLAERLKQDGAEVWIDISRILGGESLPDAISEGIECCDVFLLVWSKSAKTSRYVNLEWNSALSINKPIIPCLLDSERLPALLSSFLNVDFKDFKKGYQIIAQDLKLIVKEKDTCPISTFNHKSKLKLSIAIICVFILLFIGYLLWPFLFQNLKILSTADKINKAIESGRYNEAINKLEIELKKNPNNLSLKQVYSKLMDELKIEFEIKYSQQANLLSLFKDNEITLSDNDPYSLFIVSSDPCFIYLFRLRSSGELEKLFPNSKYVSILENPFLGGELRIPSTTEKLYFNAIAETDSETIYLIASRWKQTILEKLIYRSENTHDKELITKISNQIIIYLKEGELATDNLPGLAVATILIKHQPVLQ